MELTRAQRRVALAICCMSLVLVSMDHTIVNVALPAIHRDLHASVDGLQWVVDGYSVTVTCLLVLAGSLADRFGRRRLFTIGLAVFTVGSVLCAIAPGADWLVAFRIAQAIGGSMLNPVALSIVVNLFADRSERAFAIGVWGACVGIGYALGPIVGGLIIDETGWRGVFWINVPLGLVAIVLTAIYIPESRGGRRQGFDATAQALLIVFVGSLVYAVIEAPRNGWTAATSLALLSISAVALALFTIIEARTRQPLIDLRLFKNLQFSGAVVTLIVAYAAFDGFLFLNSLYLQGLRGFSPTRAGVYMLPVAIGALIASPLSGRMVAAQGFRLPMVTSGVAMSLSGLMLVMFTSHTSLAWILGSYTVYSIGYGAINPPTTDASIAGMPLSRAGVAAAVTSTSRNFGAALGVAVAGAIFNSRLGDRSIADGFVTASRPVWWMVCGSGLAVVALGLAMGGRRATSQRTLAAAGEQTPANALRP